MANSHHTAAEAVRVLGLDSRRVHVAHLGVDAAFRPADQRARPDPPYILLVGEFGPNKTSDAAAGGKREQEANGHGDSPDGGDEMVGLNYPGANESCTLLRMELGTGGDEVSILLASRPTHQAIGLLGHTRLLVDRDHDGRGWAMVNPASITGHSNSGDIARKV